MGVALIAVSVCVHPWPQTLAVWHRAPLYAHPFYAQPSNNELELASPTGLPADCIDVLCPTYLSVKELG